MTAVSLSPSLLFLACSPLTPEDTPSLPLGRLRSLSVWDRTFQCLYLDGPALFAAHPTGSFTPPPHFSGVLLTSTSISLVRHNQTFSHPGLLSEDLIFTPALPVHLTPSPLPALPVDAFLEIQLRNIRDLSDFRLRFLDTIEAIHKSHRFLPS